MANTLLFFSATGTLHRVFAKAARGETAEDVCRSGGKLVLGTLIQHGERQAH